MEDNEFWERIHIIMQYESPEWGNNGIDMAKDAVIDLSKEIEEDDNA